MPVMERARKVRIGICKTKTIPMTVNIRTTGGARTGGPNHRVAVADLEAAVINTASKINLKTSHSAGSTASLRVDNNLVARARAKERKARRLHLHSN